MAEHPDALKKEAESIAETRAAIDRVEAWNADLDDRVVPETVPSKADFRVYRAFQHYMRRCDE